MPERWKGEWPDISDRSGKVIVERTSINTKHLRDRLPAASSASRCLKSSCGRVPRTSLTPIPAKSSPTPTTRSRKACWRPARRQRTTSRRSHERPGLRSHISQTLRTDETAGPRGDLPHDAPGEPPTEEAVEALFQRLFYSEETYDLSRVGRMKVNSRLGRGEDITGPMTLTNEDILETIKVLVELVTGRQMTSITWATAACVAWANGREPVPAARRARGQGTSGQAETEDVRPVARRPHEGQQPSGPWRGHHRSDDADQRRHPKPSRCWSSCVTRPWPDR